MRFYVGVTDANWHRFLSQQSFDEVNFWRPRSQLAFRVIQPGAPFLFKLKKPAHAIVGVAYFTHFAFLPISTAWDVFEQENGAPDYASFLRSLGRLSEQHVHFDQQRDLGCIILSDPVFFPENEWIPAPPDWADSTVQGKSYDTASEIGGMIWEEIQMRLTARRLATAPTIVREIQPMFGEPVLVRRRLGQGEFRVRTLENYSKTCCITGETTLPVIEAAHIKPVTSGGQHWAENGLAMRADMHILFDRGLISVDPDYRIKVSSQIRDLYHNGVAYYRHEGEALRSLPADPLNQPDRELLEWHSKERFIA